MMDGQNTNPFNRRWTTRTGGQVASPSTADLPPLRVMTYNILADWAIRKNPNYQYVPAQHRYMPSRHPRIMQEVRALQPDVVCMQEVQEAHFNDVLKPDMVEMGYEGCLFRRRDDASSATFYKTGRFQMTNQHTIVLADVISEYIKNSNLALSSEMEEAIIGRMDQPHIVGLLGLRCKKTEKELIVGNIHTYWGNLKFPASVTLQISAAINALQQFAKDSGDTCILCGDFNSPPWFPSYKLLEQGLLDDQSQTACRQERPLTVTATETADLIDVMESYWNNTKPFFKSAYKDILGEEPAITNADDGDGPVFTGCLDYLWFNPNFLKVEGVLETPTEEAILEHVALPSVTFPSDHICLMAEFTFI